VTDQDDPLLDMDEVAELIGVRPATLRTYNSRANQRREAGIATAADLPEPDRTWGRSPSWKLSTIERWRHARADQPNVRDVPPAAG
jgi:predicted DNA-binding transcriptional regulator AlpA